MRILKKFWDFVCTIIVASIVVSLISNPKTPKKIVNKKQNKTKIKLIEPDYIIIAAFILLIGIHFATNFVAAYHSTKEQAQEQANTMALSLEQNPWMAWLFNFNKFRLLYSIVIAPAFLFGIYYYFRCKLIEKDIEALTALAVMFFVALSLNFMNDAAVLLGILLR